MTCIYDKVLLIKVIDSSSFNITQPSERPSDEEHSIWEEKRKLFVTITAKIWDEFHYFLCHEQRLVNQKFLLITFFSFFWCMCLVMISELSCAEFSIKRLSSNFEESKTFQSSHTWVWLTLFINITRTL